MITNAGPAYRLLPILQHQLVSSPVTCKEQRQSSILCGPVGRDGPLFQPILGILFPVQLVLHSKIYDGGFSPCSSCRLTALRGISPIPSLAVAVAAKRGPDPNPDLLLCYMSPFLFFRHVSLTARNAHGVFRTGYSTDILPVCMPHRHVVDYQKLFAVIFPPRGVKGLAHAIEVHRLGVISPRCPSFDAWLNTLYALACIGSRQPGLQADRYCLPVCPFRSAKCT